MLKKRENKFHAEQYVSGLNKRVVSNQKHGLNKINAEQYVRGLNVRYGKTKTYEQKRQEQDINRAKAEKSRVDYQAQKRYEANQKIVAYEKRKRQYENSGTGKFNRGIAKSLSFIKSPTRFIYQSGARPRLPSDPYQRARGTGQGRRGRPYGTVKYVDPRTGQPIGVYEYRKILSMQGRAIRQQDNLSPPQQIALQRLEQQQRYQQSNVEGRPVPDTMGQVNLRSIHQEADAYAHLFD